MQSCTNPFPHHPFWNWNSSHIVLKQMILPNKLFTTLLTAATGSHNKSRWTINFLYDIFLKCSSCNYPYPSPSLTSVTLTLVYTQFCTSNFKGGLLSKQKVKLSRFGIVSPALFTAIWPPHHQNTLHLSSVLYHPPFTLFLDSSEVKEVVAIWNEVSRKTLLQSVLSFIGIFNDELRLSKKLLFQQLMN